MLAEKYLPHYTYKDYKNWEGRWELIEGIPFAMYQAYPVNNQLLSNHNYLAAGRTFKKLRRM